MTGIRSCMDESCELQEVVTMVNVNSGSVVPSQSDEVNGTEGNRY